MNIHATVMISALMTWRLSWQHDEIFVETRRNTHYVLCRFFVVRLAEANIEIRRKGCLDKTE